MATRRKAVAAAKQGASIEVDAMALASSLETPVAIVAVTAASLPHQAQALVARTRLRRTSADQ